MSSANFGRLQVLGRVAAREGTAQSRNTSHLCGTEKRQKGTEPPESSVSTVML